MTGVQCSHTPVTSLSLSIAVSLSLSLHRSLNPPLSTHRHTYHVCMYVCVRGVLILNPASVVPVVVASTETKTQSVEGQQQWVAVGAVGGADEKWVNSLRKRERTVLLW